MSDKPNYLSVIKNSGFKYLWFNQILVQLAYNALNFALLVWVFKLIDSNFAVAALMLAIYLPTVLFGLFAGVFVDVADRRKIIILIDALLVFCFLIFIFIKSSYVLILINTFLINSLAQFFMPSESSSIPMLVSKKQLFLANSLFSLTLYGSWMLGFTIGGPILNIFGLNAMFLLGAVMLIFAFLTAQKLPSIKVAHRTNKYHDLLSFSNIRRTLSLTKVETLQTFKFISGKLQLVSAIGLLTLVQGVIGMLAVMMPSYLERILRIHATDSSYFVMLPLGLGMVIGAFIVGRFFQHLPKRSIVIPGILGAGILLVLVGVAPSIAQFLQSPDLPADIASKISRPRYFSRVLSLSSFFAIGSFVLGFCAVSIIIPCQTVLQENTTEKIRGKIFAVLGVLMTGFSAIPVLLVGFFSDILGVTPIFISIGIMVAFIGALAFRPSFFFAENKLPLRIRQFLGLGHWREKHLVL